MKKIFTMLLVFTLVSPVLQITKSSEAEAAAKVKTDTSQYFITQEKFNKRETASSITLKQGKLTVTAIKQKSTDLPSTTLIDSITIANGTKKYTITFEDEPETVTSISKSSSSKYLALQAGYGSGNKLFVINLNDGSYKIINDLVKSATAVETVTAYNWSSNGRKLAFSYGDPSLSRIAIYDAVYGTFTYVPRETSTISTAFIFWDRKGTFIDFASEYPSDKFKLYRYSLDTKKTKTIRALDSTEIVELNKINK
ncbi:beta-propeller domain-containing protein [Paenibacillus zanthoxyli]|uniref:hypothetical protein n=1 Tax=Paenibacillus zanthoxyli TaxID=369399 RepID=UPI0004703F0E|nr:hypothetical protein [Paenibacillus zanthoxyli]